MSQAPIVTRLYRSVIRPLAFAMDPERAHYRTMGLFGFGLGLPLVGRTLRRSMDPGEAASDAVTVAGLAFPHRVGLAAGFDKDGRWLHALQALSLIHI